MFVCQDGFPADDGAAATQWRCGDDAVADCGRAWRTVVELGELWSSLRKCGHGSDHDPETLTRAYSVIHSFLSPETVIPCHVTASLFAPVR